MLLLTNPGSNLAPEIISRYGLVVMPQRIMVDGVPHDTREHISQALVDKWVREAKRWPETVGTTAAETVAAFDQACRAGERELVVVHTSRKIINSYQSAEAARRTFLASPQGAGTRIELIDSSVTDVGTALLCILVGEAIRAGRPIDDVVRIANTAAGGVRMVIGLDTLDNMVKGGRASFLRAWVADMLGLRPLIGFADGALGVVGKYQRKGDLVKSLADELIRALGGKRRVWLAVAHTSDMAKAARLEEEVRSRLDVAWVYTRPIASGVYLHAGAGALGVAVIPVDDLGWTPPAPVG